MIFLILYYYETLKMDLAISIKQSCQTVKLLYPYINVYYFCIDITSDRSRHIYRGGQVTTIYFHGITAIEIKENSVIIILKNKHEIIMNNVSQSDINNIVRCYENFKLRKQCYNKICNNKQYNVICYATMRTVSDENSTTILFKIDDRHIESINVSHQIAYNPIKEIQQIYDECHDKIPKLLSFY